MSADEPSLRAKLASQIGPVFASDLMAHFERKAIFLVDLELSLLNVAMAVAQDQSDLVESWISTQMLTRPTEEQLASFRLNPELPFVSVVVQPFVLVQLVQNSQ